MPEFSNKDIVARLRRRLDILDTPTVNKPMVLNRTIQPVTDVDRILQEPNLVLVTKDLRGAGAWLNAFTVPAGKRWLWFAYQVEGTTGNTTIRFYNGTTGLQLYTAGTGPKFEQLPQPIYLEEAWEIQILETNDANDGSKDLTVYYLEEDATENV